MDAPGVDAGVVLHPSTINYLFVVRLLVLLVQLLKELLLPSCVLCQLAVNRVELRGVVLFVKLDKLALVPDWLLERRFLEPFFLFVQGLEQVDDQFVGELDRPGWRGGRFLHLRIRRFLVILVRLLLLLLGLPRGHELLDVTLELLLLFKLQLKLFLRCLVHGLLLLVLKVVGHRTRCAQHVKRLLGHRPLGT